MANHAPKSLFCPTRGAPSTAGSNSSDPSLGESVKEGREARGQALLWSVSFLLLILMVSNTLVLLFGVLKQLLTFHTFCRYFFEGISPLGPVWGGVGPTLSGGRPVLTPVAVATRVS